MVQINGGKRDGKGVKDYSKAAEVLDEDKLRRSGSSSLFTDRPAVKEIVKSRPASKVQYSADEEKRSFR